MADETTLTDEQRQAILLHLQGGGDPSHAAAIASGAITPQIAQQLATQGGATQSPLSLDQMRSMLVAPQSSKLGTPQLQIDPALADVTGPAAAPPEAAAAPQTQQAAAPHSASNRTVAQEIVGALALGGQQMQQQGQAFAAAVPEANKQAAEAGVKAAAKKADYKTEMGDEAHGILKKSNEDIADLDAREADAQLQRQATMDKVLAQMVDSANDVAQAAPHDFWADKSTSSRIFGILSQIAGGMANGLANQPGQPTPLDRVIQRDLDQQRLEFAQKSQTGNQASGIYNDLVKATGSTTEAFGALRIAAYKRVLGQMQELETQNSGLKENAEFLQTEANIKQKLADVLQSTAKQWTDAGTAQQKTALTSATSMANTDTNAAAQVKSAQIGKEGRVESAAAGADGKQPFMPTGVYVVPGHEQQTAKGVPEKFQMPIYNTTTGYSSLKKEVAEIEEIWNGPFDNPQKVKMIGEHQQAVARDLSKIYNAGNRVAGGAYDEMTGGIPPTMAAKLGKFLSEEFFFDNATLASLKETLSSSEAYANNALAPFGYSVTAPKAAK